MLRKRLMGIVLMLVCMFSMGHAEESWEVDTSYFVMQKPEGWVLNLEEADEELHSYRLVKEGHEFGDLALLGLVTFRMPELAAAIKEEVLLDMLASSVLESFTGYEGVMEIISQEYDSRDGAAWVRISSEYEVKEDTMVTVYLALFVKNNECFGVVYGDDTVTPEEQKLTFDALCDSVQVKGAAQWGEVERSRYGILGEIE